MSENPTGRSEQCRRHRLQPRKSEAQTRLRRMGCGASVPKATQSGVVIKEAGAFKLPDGETAGKDSLLFCPPPKTKTSAGGKYRGEWVCDGGLSDFKPVIDADTITVSPFYFDYADIKPSRYIPPWWALYPPRTSSLEVSEAICSYATAYRR